MADYSEGVRIPLLRDAVEVYRAEHALLGDRWKALETKAQGTVAIAGIFLAGAFTFIRNLHAGSPAVERWALAALAAMLGVAVGLAILALRVRAVPDPAPGVETERMAVAVCALTDDEIDERLPHLYGEQFTVWREVNQQTRENVQEKAKYLGWAQGWLMAAALLMCGLSIRLALTLG